MMITNRALQAGREISADSSKKWGNAVFTLLLYFCACAKVVRLENKTEAK